LHPQKLMQLVGFRDPNARKHEGAASVVVVLASAVTLRDRTNPISKISPKRGAERFGAIRVLRPPTTGHSISTKMRIVSAERAKKFALVSERYITGAPFSLAPGMLHEIC
jgi:hypothetical protein